MLTVLLAILKWIGIVLACIIGFIIFLLLLILLCPICYKGAGNYEKKEGNKPRGYFRVSFLGLVFRAKVSYADGLIMKARIFGFPIFSNEKKEKSSCSKNKSYEELMDFPDEESDSSDITNKVKIDEIKENSTKEDVKLDSEKIESEKIAEELKHSSKKNSKEKGNIHKEAIKDHKVPLFRRLADKLRSLPQKARWKVQTIYDKMVNVLDNLEFFMNLLESDEFSKAKSLIFKSLGKVFKSILPRKLRIRMDFAFENPETMGTLLSYGAMFYPIYGKSINLIPDFESEDKLLIKASLKGHFSLITFLWIALKVYFNRNLKKVIYKFKNKNKYIERKNKKRAKEKEEAYA